MGDARQRPGPASGALAVLAATALALAISAANHDGSGAPGPGVVGDEPALAEVAVSATPATARRVERLRELEFERVPRPRVVTAATLGRIERAELRRRDAPRGLGADEAVARIAGLLAPDEELDAAIGASEDLAAAAYDTRADRLYVVRDAVSASPALVEFLLAHELTHALEDQRYGLAEPSAAATDDGALASLALTEGTATALMVDYAGRHLNPLALGLAAAGLDAGTGDVPAFVVDQLEWTYLGGMRFVNALRRLARGWKLVDYALARRPPANTEQVLHPLKYVKDERPAPTVIAGRELRRRGWRRADGGVIGELATRLLLERGASPRTATRAAAGWEGDRYELWRRGVAPAKCAENCRGDLVLVIRWRVQDGADARQLHRALERYARVGLGASALGQGWSLDGGALALAAGGNRVAAVFAPSSSLARSVAGAQVGR